MNVSSENYGHVTVLTLKGEFTADDVDHFNRAAQECTAKDVRDFVVDLEKVPFVDSAAMETLIALRDGVAEQLGMVKLCAADENVRKILEVTRLDQQFEQFADLIEAVKSFR